MKYFYLFLLYCIFFSFLPIPSIAQEGNYFNLNIDNGLPSNHVYGAITDKHGYLWITTPKGIARYNGYDFKLFNLSEGLPYEDIWQLLEDKKGRIWLSNISDEIGYIYNNKYHKAYIKNLQGTIYPRNMQLSDDGIIFWSYYMTGNPEITICKEKNDTLFTDIINENVFTKEDQKKEADMSGVENKEIPFFFINKNDSFFSIYTNNLYKILINNGKKTAQKQYQLKDPLIQNKLRFCKSYVLYDHIIWHSSKDKRNSCIAMGLSDNSTQDISTKTYGDGEDINYIYQPSDIKKKKIFYLISKKYIYEFEEKNKIEFIKKIPVNTLIDGSKISVYNDNNFGRGFIGSTTEGLYIKSKQDNFFIKYDKLNIHNYRYIGGKTDQICFWWNSSTNTLMRISTKTNVDYKTLKNINNLYNIVPYNKDFLLFSLTAYLLQSGNTLYPFTSFPGNIFSGIQLSKDIVFISAVGLYNFRHTGDKNSYNLLDPDRYTGLCYDSLRKDVWAYNPNKIFILDSNNKQVILKKDQINKFGVNKLENIVFDNKYGNIFFKGQKSITIYNPQKQSYRELFKNFNLKESSVYIYHDKLIVIGRFGVLFTKVLGLDSLSTTLFYQNFKNTNYNYVHDCQISWNELIMNTDKGVYKVIIPNDSTLMNNVDDSTTLSCSFIINYRDSIFNIHSGDTLQINQKDYNIQFDVINVSGNGALTYNYRIENDSTWHELNTNELHIPQLSPGSYYKLSVQAHDNVWYSNDLCLYVYIMPHWWQTHNGRRLAWIGVIILILLLFTTAILITRKLVLRATQKKNLQMELELKSIYAQINPHFIFNTLNSALLLVSKNKMEEAYTHIAKFSRLLRSYIKSSRNKFITIAEEIKNLNNYIELQQTRFKDKFDYIITTDSKINQEKVKIPSLLLQPFVENAINHGILNKHEKGFLQIAFNISDKKNEIICTIDDDGVGRKHSKFINESKVDKDESYGNLLIKDLITIFNKYEQMDIEITYADKEYPKNGTTVKIYIRNLQLS